MRSIFVRLLARLLAPFVEAVDLVREENARPVREALQAEQEKFLRAISQFDFSDVTVTAKPSPTWAEKERDAIMAARARHESKATSSST